MFLNIYLKEFKRNLKNVSFHLFTAALFLGAYFFASNLNPNSSMMGLSISKEWHNAPILIAKLTARFSVVGVLFAMVMVGRAVTRDFSVGIHDFFFTVPMSRASYLGGRFLGGFAANVLIYSGIAMGFIAGCWVIDPAYYGPFQLKAFLLPALVILIPNLLFIGSIFFSLATLSRKTTMTYLAGVGFIMIYALMQAGFTAWENDTAKILIDPFGISALDILTKYWTVADINLRQIPLQAPLVWNRIIWMAVSFGILLYTQKRFRFVSILEKKKEKRLKIERIEFKGVHALGAVRPAVIDDTFILQLRKCFHLVFREFKRIVFHPAFLILTFMAISEIVVNFVGNAGHMGDNVFPLTSRFLEQNLHIWIYMIPLTIFFSGLIIWRERDDKSNEFYDTLPVPDWLSYLSKLFTMMSIQLFYVILAMLTGIVTQVVGFGYTNIELGLYFRYLFGITLLKLWFLTIIVFFIHNLVNNKILGFFISGLFVAADLIIFEVLKVENFLFRYGQLPRFVYSNLNGFGHYGPLIIWYSIYWFFFASILGVLTSLLWRRSNETALKFRFRVGLQKLNLRFQGALGILLVLFLATGGYISYNKYMLNQYTSKDQRKKIEADYEKKYARYLNAPQPQMVRVNLQVDLFPEERKALIKGYYVLKNKTNQQIDEIYVNLSDQYVSQVNQLEFSPPAVLTHQGREYGFRTFKLQNPLEAGSEIRLDFDLTAQAKGFTENNPKDQLARKGTCILLTEESPDYFPLIGYIRNLEITDKRDRKKYGLPERPKNPPLEEIDRSICLFQNDLTEYDAIISTSQSQTVVSNGSLIRQWTENDRNYFHYQSEGPMDNEFVFASSEYEVKKDQYEGIGIEVYYDQKHPDNVQRMIRGVKRSFDYCTKNFCPFPYRFIRIAEIPNYVDFGARSQPTLFTWSENAGFISNLEDPKEIDMVFGICTHEMAHQWWAYIVRPAYAEGAEMLTETMAMYVEVMCLEKEYGKDISRKFLKEEMNRYLRRRKKDVAGERPLMRSYADQYYLNYPKSTVLMYALQDYLGEDCVNRALKKVVEEYGHREDVFPTSLDLVNAFKTVTPDSLQYLITDLFETITLWENETKSASYVVRDDGKYKVTLEISAYKFRADSIGNQTEIPIQDYIDIGVMGENGEELYLNKHKITRNESDIEIIVDQKPVQAGIDPHLILIDRERNNNLVAVSRK
ncbi:MAG TPA: ABC transporter permease subunit [candidate division Zixibacteria bacterium]